MQADFRASGDRLLDLDQKHKSLDLISKNWVNFILQVHHRKGLEEEPLECQEKDAEVNTRTAMLCSAQGNSDLSELMAIDEMIQYKSFSCKKNTTQKESPSAHVE